MAEITNEILAENSINQSMLYTDDNDNKVVYVFKNDEYITATTAEELAEALSGGGVAIAENLFKNKSYGGTGTTTGTDMDEGDASPTDDLSSFFTKIK